MSSLNNAIEWLEDSNISINTTLNEILESYAEYKLNEYISGTPNSSDNKINLIKAIQSANNSEIDVFNNLLVNLSNEATV